MSENKDDQIVVDEREYDTTSDYGSSFESELTSLKSSIMNYVFENGRRYHAYKAGKYPLPNDESEQDRLDLHHHIYSILIDGKVALAPLSKNIQRVLDIGTGTGIWAVECADEFPSAQVIGTDLSPIQPSWVPPNCSFEIDDAEQDWLWPENHFDFIHSRNLAQSIKDWSKYAKQMFEHVKPGGWVEMVENFPGMYCDDGSAPKDAYIFQLTDHFTEATKKMGLPQPTEQDHKKNLENAGFEDVQIASFKTPFGTWPKDEKLKQVGRCNLVMGEKLFHSYNLALCTRVLGMSQEDAYALCDGARNDVLNKKYHTYTGVWHIYGRKPENAK